MECIKRTYYNETLTRVPVGKASREKNVEWVWLSVDPLANEFPAWTSYNNVHNNPVNLIDPDGRAAGSYRDEQCYSPSNPKTLRPNIGNSL